MKTIGVLLAAGWSERFGDEDKLLAPLHGKPLVTYAADAILGAGLDAFVAVTGSDQVARHLPRFECVERHGARWLQSDSLRAGVARAAEMGATQVVVVLGDMPCVRARTIQDVCAAGERYGVAATTDGSRRMPPVSFGDAQFPAILRQGGDAGARGIIAELPDDALVRVSPWELQDVDTPSDLTAFIAGNLRH